MCIPSSTEGLQCQVEGNAAIIFHLKYTRCYFYFVHNTEIHPCPAGGDVIAEYLAFTVTLLVLLPGSPLTTAGRHAGNVMQLNRYPPTPPSLPQKCSPDCAVLRWY